MPFNRNSGAQAPGLSAPLAVELKPANDEAPAVGAARGFKDQHLAQKKVAEGYGTTTTTTQDTATVLADDVARKEFATLAAQFALAGHSLTRSNTADGAATFYATRWGMIKFLPTLDAARAFLAQIGGSQ